MNRSYERQLLDDHSNMQKWSGGSGVAILGTGHPLFPGGALTKTRGKIDGADGAAALLGLKPTTLSSRVHRLGLKRLIADS